MLRRDRKKGRSRTFQTEGQGSLSHDKMIIIPRLLVLFVLSNGKILVAQGVGWLAKEEKGYENAKEAWWWADRRYAKLGCFFIFYSGKVFLKGCGVCFVSEYMLYV